jgi:hypothetical protein
VPAYNGDVQDISISTSPLACVPFSDLVQHQTGRRTLTSGQHQTGRRTLTSGQHHTSVFVDDSALIVANVDAIFNCTQSVLDGTTYGTFYFLDLGGEPGGGTQYVFFRRPDASGIGTIATKGKSWNPVSYTSDNKAFSLYRGPRGTGDLVQNFDDFVNTVQRHFASGVHLVIAHGYTPFEEIASALRTLRPEGDLVLFLPASVERPLLDALYLASLCFEAVDVFQPASSTFRVFVGKKCAGGKRREEVNNLLASAIGKMRKGVVSVPEDFVSWLQERIAEGARAFGHSRAVAARVPRNLLTSYAQLYWDLPPVVEDKKKYFPNSGLIRGGLDLALPLNRSLLVPVEDAYNIHKRVMSKLPNKESYRIVQLNAGYGVTTAVFSQDSRFRHIFATDEKRDRALALANNLRQYTHKAKQVITLWRYPEDGMYNGPDVAYVDLVYPGTLLESKYFDWPYPSLDKSISGWPRKEPRCSAQQAPDHGKQWIRRFLEENRHRVTVFALRIDDNVDLGFLAGLRYENVDNKLVLL